MSRINDGGPVHPCQTSLGHMHEGKSLRADFAGLAMQVLLAQATEFPDENWRIGVALDAWKMADAMLEAERMTEGAKP